MTDKKRMTAKQRVLRKYPDAWYSFCAKGIFLDYNVHRQYTVSRNVPFPTPRQAWADAAKRLKERKLLGEQAKDDLKRLAAKEGAA